MMLLKENYSDLKERRLNCHQGTGPEEGVVDSMYLLVSCICSCYDQVKHKF